MSQEDMQLALEKLQGLRAHVENYFENEEQVPGLYWGAIYPIRSAIDHAITVIDGHVQLQQAQQIQEKQAS